MNYVHNCGILLASDTFMCKYHSKSRITDQNKMQNYIYIRLLCLAVTKIATRYANNKIHQEAVKIRAAVRLKILITINRAIKIFNRD